VGGGGGGGGGGGKRLKSPPGKLRRKRKNELTLAHAGKDVGTGKGRSVRSHLHKELTLIK